MDRERELRSEFREALDVVLPPVPWLESAVGHRLHEAQRETIKRTSWRHPPRLALAGALMVLLAASVAAALLISQWYAAVQVHTPPPQPGSGAIPIATTASFNTARDGLVLTQRGLLITHDGGVHWRLQLKIDWSHYYNVKFVDPNNIVILSGNGGAEALYSTSDGGSTWRTTRVAEVPAVSIAGQDMLGDETTFFLNAREGWRQVRSCLPPYLGDTSPGDCALEPPVAVSLYHTTDSGAHWTNVARVDQGDPASHGLSLNVPPLLNLVFFDSEHGFMTAQTTDRVATLYRTQDGGHNWEFVRLTAPPGGYPPFDKSVWPPTPTMFGSRGVLYQESPQNVAFVYTTADYGRTWSVPRVVPNFGAISLMDASHWSAIDSDTLYRTSDAGATWHKTKIVLPPGLRIYQVFAVDERTLWAIAEGDVPFPGVQPSSCVQSGMGPACYFAIQSIDGGAHWTMVKLPPN